MYNISKSNSTDTLTVIYISLLVIISLVVLNSISSVLFPTYYLYTFIGVLVFIIFSKLDFEILSTFSKQLYIGSIIFLIIPLIIGQVTRGTVRWIQIGALTIQPAEIVRPFLLIYFAKFLVTNKFTSSFLVKAFFYLLVPIGLIVIQPSLGVAVITSIGLLGVLLASGINKKHFAISILVFLLALPVSFFFMKDYQRQRITTFLNPAMDPLGAGYNSIQSMIAVGSGKFLGKGLGKGIQTQLKFLPEKHTDFVFAAVSEEMGFVGASVLLVVAFLLLSRVLSALDHAKDPVSRAYIAGFFLTLLVQMAIHVGMNIGLLPITGLPFPLVSAGGSSFIATMMGLGIVVGARKK